MIIDNIRLDTNAKKRVQNKLPDVIQYSVVCSPQNWGYLNFV